MGLHFLGVHRIGFLDRQLRHQGPGAASGPLGGFLLGLAFAVGWTPCIGPVMAAILSVAASQDTALEGAALLGLYSAGLGVPFLLAGMAIGPFLTFFQSFKRHLGTVEKVMGGLLALTGILFLTGRLPAFPTGSSRPSRCCRPSVRAAGLGTDWFSPEDNA